MRISIDDLIADRDKFNEFVYTPVEVALDELKRRSDNQDIKRYLEDTLPAGIPEIIKHKKCAFLSRSLATPNFESRRFLGMVDAVDELTAVFWEYYSDDFRPNVNESKFNLAKMTFYLGLDKSGNQKVTKKTILDFNTENSKKIIDVKTTWGQSFVDFHHELLLNSDFFINNEKLIYYDATEWYLRSGITVNKYYKNLFKLFLANGILFENFVISNEAEADFTRNVFLPAFLEIYEETGMKPLMVALEPTEIEGESFWMYYPHSILEFVKNKINLI